MKKFIIMSMILINSLLTFSQTKITFINPGKSTDIFWLTVSQFMRAAARDLNVNLEIIYSEENVDNVRLISQSILKRKIKPDYLIIVNQDLIAPEIIEMTEKSEIKTFLIFDDLNLEQKEEYLSPREVYKNWIGSFIPYNYDAGYSLADYLSNEAKASGYTNPNIIAIAENKVSPGTISKLEGLYSYALENSEVNLIDTAYSDWDKNKAYELAMQMLHKYPQANIIWTSSDSIALEVLRAVTDFGLNPGEDILIGGINWSPEALKNIMNTKLECSVGGHFMIGAWALVILKDLDEGIDFVDETFITELEVNLFETIHKNNVEDYYSYFPHEDWDKINFKKFSKYYNKNLENYNFNYISIIENIDY